MIRSFINASRETCNICGKRKGGKKTLTIAYDDESYEWRIICFECLPAVLDDEAVLVPLWAALTRQRNVSKI